MRLTTTTNQQNHFRLGLAAILIFMAALLFGACSDNEGSRTPAQDFDNPCPQMPANLSGTSCDDLENTCDSSVGADEGCGFVRCSCGHDVTGINQVWNCASLECEQEDASDDGTPEYEACEEPPSELDGSVCSEPSVGCITSEERPTCCEATACECNKDNDGSLVWNCRSVGCERETAEECPAICDTDPNAPFCAPDDDASDGDAHDAESEN